MYIGSSRRRRPVRAGEEPQEPAAAPVDVAPEAGDLLFEAEDVAELLAEVTGEAVEATTSDSGDTVTFAIGKDEFVVEAEGNEEVVESSVRPTGRGRRPVAASRPAPSPATRTRRGAATRQVAASRVIRKVPSRRA